uniref:Uncharacterized protein n=1 Tax=Opuntia streptacantha TaxID=393608 RepID=A0A7C8ZPX2_OPUST
MAQHVVVFINQFKSAFLYKGSCVQRRRFVLKVRAIISGREMHLDIIKVLTLAQIVVISGREQSRSVTPNNGFQITSMNVEGHSFESVHCGKTAPSSGNSMAND